VYWNWDITYECNYKCSYCHFWKRKERYPYVEIDKWKAIWDSIFEKYWCCHIRFSGGEPFVYPHFIELIRMLSERHTVDVTTNLSFDINLFIKKISPGGITLSASFHPEFIEIDEFLDKTVFLNEKGFPTSIAFVAYPPYLKDLEKYKSYVGQRKIFNQAGILFKIIPFMGEFEGEKYPEGYSHQQKKLLEEVATSTEIEPQKELNVQWLDQGEDEKYKKDKYCRMGQMYAKILPNGDVTRCCHSEFGKLGSIFDENFMLLDEPAPCKTESCPCWKPMIVGYKEDKYPIFWEMPEHKIYKFNRTKP
jgi:MoaA/NifB/PqqE/SkfB family radical SAM enzyme